MNTENKTENTVNTVEKAQSDNNRTLVTSRDFELLKLIAEQKFLTSEQIRSRFFAGRDPSIQKRRLARLVAAGFLRPQRVYTESRRMYLLNKGGWLHLKALGFWPALPQNETLDLRLFEHDKALTDMRMALEACGISSWKSKKVLSAGRSHRGRIPDAVFTLNDKEVALEFENAYKDSSRYREIFKVYSRGWYPHVLYVFRDPEHMKFVGSLAENLGKTEFHFDISQFNFAKEKDVLEHGLKGLVYNLKIGLLKLGDLQ